MGVVQPEIKPQVGKCYMLAYNQGYANLSSVHYLAVKNTANKGACCNLCLRDSRCVAWTRVAGEQCFSVRHVCILTWRLRQGWSLIAQSMAVAAMGASGAATVTCM